MASPLRITSPKNPKLINAIKLRDSKHRRTQGLFLIDGIRSIELALESGVVIRELFVEESEVGTSRILHRCIDRIGAVYALDRSLMEKINYGEQSHQAVAVAENFATDLESLSTRIQNSYANRVSPSHLFLVVDRIEKPGNLGAILRTADAAGLDAVLLSDSICDPFNPNAIRSSLGAVFTLPIGLGTMETISEWLHAQNVVVYTARVEGANDYTSTKFADRAALVVGNEANGLGDRWLGNDCRAVRIPMHGKIDSLNASVSTAVIVFEMVRQLGHSRASQD